MKTADRGSAGLIVLSLKIDDQIRFGTAIWMAARPMRGRVHGRENVGNEVRTHRRQSRRGWKLPQSRIRNSMMGRMAIA